MLAVLWVELSERENSAQCYSLAPPPPQGFHGKNDLNMMPSSGSLSLCHYYYYAYASLAIRQVMTHLSIMYVLAIHATFFIISVLLGIVLAMQMAL